MKASAVENAAIASTEATAGPLGLGRVHGLSMMSANGARNSVAAVACPAATSIGLRPRERMRRA